MTTILSLATVAISIVWGIFFSARLYFDQALQKIVYQQAQKQNASKTTSFKRTTIATKPQPVQDGQTEWGVAQKIGEHTYTIRVGQDDRMATAEEIVTALNNYRQVNGRGTLSWDDKLGAYANTRADLFKSRGSTDAHAGFNDYLDNHDGFSQLGFSRLGENSYFGGPLYGVHLIEWVFAKSPDHNANQLDAGWTHVGIGVNNTAVDIVFGGRKN